MPIKKNNCAYIFEHFFFVSVWNGRYKYYELLKRNSVLKSHSFAIKNGKFINF